MGAPLVIFLVVVIGLAIGGVWLFRATLQEIAEHVKEHAKAYAIPYVKGAALIAITAGATFDETFRNLTADEAARLTWWGWAILFWKPITAGLGVLVAFLDRSVQTATDKRAGTTPPIPPR